jgi:hypothetical protein
MSFSQAFFHFKDFFYKKTGIHWDQRLEGIKMGEEFFVYTPPVLGRPVGWVCEGYVRPELRVRELTEGKSEKTNTEGESGEDGEEREGEVVYDTDSEVEVEDDDSEDDGTTGPSRESGSREVPEESSVPSRFSGFRADSEVEEDGGSFNTKNASFSTSLNTSIGGSFEMGSRLGSEESGETERSQTTTPSSQESDGLRGVFEEVVRAVTPPGLIYLSD